VKISHGAVVETNSQLNVPHNCEVSSGRASMPAQRLTDVGFDSRLRPRFQLYSVGSLMGNRLADCSVGVVSAIAEPPQSVPALVVTGSHRDCNQWPPAQASSAVLQHGKPTDWSSGQQLASACGVNRPVWVSQHSPATVNGIGHAQSNYVAMLPSQAYDQRGGSQIRSPFLPASIRAGRFHAGSNPVDVRQLWMQVRPRQQQQQIVHSAGHSSVGMPPIQNVSVVGVVPPVTWQPRFASPSLTSAQLSASAAHVTVAAAECRSVASPAADSRPVTGPLTTSLTDSSPLRNNTVGRIYQLPVATSAVTTGTCEACVASPTSVSSPESIMTSPQSAVSVKSSCVKSAVITSVQPETERTYVAGRRYTVTKEDGVTVEGIWDGKYLTVLTTSVAKSTASQASG